MQYAILWFVVNHRISSSTTLLQPRIGRPYRSVGIVMENRLWLVSTAGTLRGADAEAVPELAGDLGKRAHAAGTGGLSALGLLGPVVYSP